MRTRPVRAGVSINLGSDQPLTARVPASVTVPAGATRASLKVTTFPSSFTNTVQLSAAPTGDGGALPAPSLLAPAVDARFQAGSPGPEGRRRLVLRLPDGPILFPDREAGPLDGAENRYAHTEV